jgi:uncharacterized membrane protein
MASLETLAAEDHGVAANYVERPAFFQLMLYLHAGFAGVALALSALQFAARLRRRSPRTHRLVGRVVIGTVCIAGPAGFMLSWVNEAGLLGLFGFGGLAVLWTTCAVRAYLAARRRDIIEHRRWAIRMFACTYAGVTLRLWSLLLVGAMTAGGVGLDTAVDVSYYIVTFLSWVPNVLVAEWWLRRSARRPRRSLAATGRTSTGETSVAPR